jgi:hypothetical protein
MSGFRSILFLQGDEASTFFTLLESCSEEMAGRHLIYLAGQMELPPVSSFPLFAENDYSFSVPMQTFGWETEGYVSYSFSPPYVSLTEKLPKGYPYFVRVLYSSEITDYRADPKDIVGASFAFGVPFSSVSWGYPSPDCRCCFIPVSCARDAWALVEFCKGYGLHAAVSHELPTVSGSVPVEVSDLL